jgi:solute carrier family 25 phosphate transporter 3
MQTTLPVGAFPTNFGEAFAKFKAAEGLGGLYKGLVPLWSRQVPYTIAKFVFFEKTVQAFYEYLLTAKKRSEYSKTVQLSVTFASGYIAGVLCAIVSHPADTMVSKLYKEKSDAGMAATVKKIYGDIGFMGLWRGLGARIVMVGTLTGFQWWIYDSFKTAVGLGTTQGFKK